MKILVTHNSYLQAGGEDSVVDAEVALLTNKGNQVHTYFRRNQEINDLNKLKMAMYTLWSRDTSRDLSKKIEAIKPDIIHSHNTFPLISPSIYWVASKYSIPIVQTLHNFRLMCPQGMFLRNGNVCEYCLGKLPYFGVIKKCYRESYIQTSILSTMLELHRFIGTYKNKVSRYIALNDFCRDKFISGGLPGNKIMIKPNFVDIENGGSLNRKGGLFVGRLSHEKGIDILAHAFLMSKEIKFNVVGDGPDNRLLNEDNIIKHGWLERNEIIKLMKKSSYLILPSRWYENFPMTILEAFASELPVIASRIGALEEIIEDGVTGLLVNPNDPVDLAKKIRWAEDNPELMKKLGENARRVYENNYTPEINYLQLMSIYKSAIHVA